ncbi:MAG TPA: prolipoprotein diacylglyceryl transferase [Gemmatimonadaceae bacterium]|nr:prolipoprotein diacylglyceryl transferase [Gemmatimonadaceae bacterium]
MTIPYPPIHPVMFHLGPLPVRWYSVMYVVGYVVGARIAERRGERGVVKLTHDDVGTMVGYLMAGMIIGARLMYAAVYEPGHFIHDPIQFFEIWHGGLSFHGAVLGMVAAAAIFAHRRSLPFLQVADTLALAGTPGLFFGRLGNFFNAELYGRPTHVPWAMIFPTDPLHIPRHPSQLYEAIGEGVILALVLFWLERRSLKRGWYRPGVLSVAFLIGYGVIRFLIEFTRQPDPQLGLVWGPFSAGQLLCAAMVVAGLAFSLYVRRQPAQRPAGTLAPALGASRLDS